MFTVKKKHVQRMHFGHCEFVYLYSCIFNILTLPKNNNDFKKNC